MHVFQPLYIGDPQLYKALPEPTLFVYVMNTFITFPFLKFQFWHLFIQSFFHSKLSVQWLRTPDLDYLC